VQSPAAYTGTLPVDVVRSLASTWVRVGVRVRARVRARVRVRN
jgi:hypothetical protein